jgi:hypothetical protein
LTGYPCFLNSSVVLVFWKGEFFAIHFLERLDNDSTISAKYLFSIQFFRMLQSGINFRWSLGGRLDEFLPPNCRSDSHDSMNSIISGVTFFGRSWDRIYAMALLSRKKQRTHETRLGPTWRRAHISFQWMPWASNWTIWASTVAFM